MFLSEKPTSLIFEKCY